MQWCMIEGLQNDHLSILDIGSFLWVLSKLPVKSGQRGWTWTDDDSCICIRMCTALDEILHVSACMNDVFP